MAACAGPRITGDGIKILQDRGISLLQVDGAKNAADQALLEEARRRSDAGCRRFLVASDDSFFRQIADLGQLEILIWHTQRPRLKDYAARAANLHRLAIPETRAVARHLRRPGVPDTAGGCR